MSNEINSPFPLGGTFYFPDAWDSSAEGLFETAYRSFVSVMNSVPQFIGVAVDYNAPVSGWVVSAQEQAYSNANSILSKTLTPVIGLPLASVAPGSASPDLQFKAFASGQFDATIRNIVT